MHTEKQNWDCIVHMCWVGGRRLEFHRWFGDRYPMNCMDLQHIRFVWIIEKLLMLCHKGLYYHDH